MSDIKEDDTSFAPTKFVKETFGPHWSSDTETDEEEKNQEAKTEKELHMEWTRDAQEQYGEVNPSLGFFFSPHTVTLLLLALVFMLYFALFETDESMPVNVKRGLIASAAFFTFIGIIQFKEGPFTRPHPAFWKAILSMSILYELFLVFLLFMKVEDAREIFSYYSSNLGKVKPNYRSYSDCELNWQNTIGSIDEFVLLHTFGWMAKTIILRDVWLAWIISAAFELMEYSFAHHIPNFNECWWDHWILDVLICNQLGIFLGMKTLRFLESKHYDWRGWSKITTKRGKAKRAIQQFTPYEWTVFHWSATKTLKRWLTVLFILFMFLQIEVNAFYLKYLLWFPSTEFLNGYRLILLIPCGAVGVREAYRYLTDPKCRRLGTQGWMCVAIIQTETMICFKWSRGQFFNPMPDYIMYSWFGFFALLFVFTVFRFSPLVRLLDSAKKPESEQKKED